MSKVVFVQVPGGCTLTTAELTPVLDGHWLFKLNFEAGSVELELDLTELQNQIKKGLANLKKESLT